MVRGDGTIGTYATGKSWSHQFRLALADSEALDRTERYLKEAGVETSRSSFGQARPDRRPMAAIRASGKQKVDAIREMIQWPQHSTPDWQRGFLAGIFDAEGSCSRGILRIANCDDQVLSHTTEALRALRIHQRSRGPAADEPPALRTADRWSARRGSASSTSTDPAITRKRSIDGVALKCRAALRVVDIEALGLELPLWDITTGTGDFIANGVVSHNCFARNTHTYLDLDAGADFDRKVIVKVNAGELVRRELAAPKWRGAHVAMGTNVDCYQRAEGRYRLMPQIIAALRDFANPFSILTKGTLILRDLPLLRQAAEVTRVGSPTRSGFVDEQLWRTVEPGTPQPAASPGRRPARSTDAGFEVGVLMAPILPGLSDNDESIDATVAAIAAAGAASVTPMALHLRPGAREWYAHWLAREYPAPGAPLPRALPGAAPTRRRRTSGS